MCIDIIISIPHVYFFFPFGSHAHHHFSAFCHTDETSWLYIIYTDDGPCSYTQK